MAIFGRFESCDVRPGRNVTETTYTARPQGTRGRPQYVVRVLTSGRGGPETDTERYFRDQLRIQQEVIASPKLKGKARHWLTIHDQGVVDEGLFCVTDHYQISLEELIGRRLTINGRQLGHVVRSIAGGLRELKLACDRPHGNLLAENILVGSGLLDRARISLFAPLPSNVARAVAEEDDVRAVGQLIFHLVNGRPVRPLSDVPVAPSDNWHRLGRTGESWRALCNRLLDPNVAPPTLAELERLIPSGGGGRLPLWLGLAAVIAAVVTGALFLLPGLFAPKGNDSRQQARDLLEERIAIEVVVQSDDLDLFAKNEKLRLYARKLREQFALGKPLSTDPSRGAWHRHTARDLLSGPSLTDDEWRSLRDFCRDQLKKAGEDYTDALADWPLRGVARERLKWLEVDMQWVSRAAPIRRLLDSLEPENKLSQRLTGTLDLLRWAPVEEEQYLPIEQRFIELEKLRQGIGGFGDPLLSRFDRYAQSVLAAIGSEVPAGQRAGSAEDLLAVKARLDALNKLASDLELAARNRLKVIDGQAMAKLEGGPGGVYGQAAATDPARLEPVFNQWLALVRRPDYEILPPAAEPRADWSQALATMRRHLADFQDHPQAAPLAVRLANIERAAGLPWIVGFRDEISGAVKEMESLSAQTASLAAPLPEADDPRVLEAWTRRIATISERLATVTAPDKLQRKAATEAAVADARRQADALKDKKWITAWEKTIRDGAKRVQDRLTFADNESLALLDNPLGPLAARLAEIRGLFDDLPPEDAAEVTTLKKDIATKEGELEELKKFSWPTTDVKLLDRAENLRMQLDQLDGFLDKQPSGSDPRADLLGKLSAIDKRVVGDTLKLTDEQKKHIDGAKAALEELSAQKLPWSWRHRRRILEAVEQHRKAMAGMLDPVRYAIDQLPDDSAIGKEKSKIRQAWIARRAMLARVVGERNLPSLSDDEREQLAQALTTLAGDVAQRLKLIDAKVLAEFPAFEATPKDFNEEAIKKAYDEEVNRIIVTGIATTELLSEAPAPTGPSPVLTPTTAQRLGLRLDDRAWGKWQADAEAFAANRDHLGRWITALGRIERHLDDGYAWTEATGGETIAEYAAPWFGESAKAEALAGLTATYGKFLGTAPDRLKKIYDAASTTDRETLIKTADEQDWSLAVTAWQRLGELKSPWPDGLKEMASEQAIRERLMKRRDDLDTSRGKWLGDELTVQGAERWQWAINTGGSSSVAIDTVVKAAAEFNVDLKKSGSLTDLLIRLRLKDMELLTDTSRFNLLLHRFRARLLALDGDGAKARGLAQEFERATASLCLDDAVRRHLAKLKAETARPDEQATDWSKVGPGLAGWSAREDAVSGVVTVTYTPPTALEVKPLKFIRLDNPNPNTMLGTTEVSVGQFKRITEENNGLRTEIGKCVEVGKDSNGKPIYLEVKSDRRFVSPWEGSLFSMTDAKQWRSIPENTSAKVKAEFAKDSPTYQHPMQYLPPQAALLFARGLHCRLPTGKEWIAAARDHRPARQNLRDKTWSAYQEELKKMNEKHAAPLLLDRIFGPDDADKPREAVPADADNADGHIWFTPVDQEGFASAKNVYHLLGNVAEFVCDDITAQEALPPNADAVVAMLRAGQGGSNHASLGVIGGSALSSAAVNKAANEGVVTPFRFVAGARVFENCYADVGFRLAFTAKGGTPLAQRIGEWIKAQGYLP